jgi:hypothetical protein
LPRRSQAVPASWLGSRLYFRPRSVVYASVEGVNEHSYQECLEELEHKAPKLGATAPIGLQRV